MDLRKSGYLLESVNHWGRKYINGQVHTNGFESFSVLLKRGSNGTYHKVSAKHLPPYVNEFASRHNIREHGTADQMAMIARGFFVKRLPYNQQIP